MNYVVCTLMIFVFDMLVVQRISVYEGYKVNRNWLVIWRDFLSTGVYYYRFVLAVPFILLLANASEAGDNSSLYFTLSMIFGLIQLAVAFYLFERHQRKTGGSS